MFIAHLLSVCNVDGVVDTFRDLFTEGCPNDHSYCHTYQ